jgi:NDP-sugar pyrophosphorylase family protein
VILAVGYLHEQVRGHFGDRWNGMALEYSVEKTALGTGGALRLAAEAARSSELAVLNGDTFYKADLSLMRETLKAKNADWVMALARMDVASQYGAVELSGEGRVQGFLRRGEASGLQLVNAGVYWVSREVLGSLERVSSLEKELEDGLYRKWRIHGLPGSGSFIDIGTPQRFDQAQREPSLVQLFS